MNPRLALAIGLLLSFAATATFGADENHPVRKHWFVSGRVQGVSFRAFTYESATDLKLVGWVRNLTDGRVEIVAEGPAKGMKGYFARDAAGHVKGAHIGGRMATKR